jgi:hypothetical protein
MNYVIYHANCYDGFTSAYVMYYYFEFILKNKNYKLIPCNHGEPFPIDKAEIDKDRDTCTVVDFSFKRDVVLEYKDLFASFLILDHHLTAYEDLNGLSCFTYDVNKSGALITFDEILGDQYYFSQSLKNESGMDENPLKSQLERLKWLVDRVSDRDLFKFEYGDETHAVYYYLSYKPMSLEFWNDTVCNKTIDEILAIGSSLRVYEDTLLKKLLSRSNFKIKVTDGENEYIIPCVNVSKEFGSNICNRLITEYGFDMSCYFHFENGQIAWGIRSKKDVDCSKIAKYYGGGGHKNASGWVTKLYYPFQSIMSIT